MSAVVNDGFLGNNPSPARLDKYLVAGKTGTAEVNRPYQKVDSAGKLMYQERIDQYGQKVLDANGSPVIDPVMVPCNYQCNRERGIYDHSFVGFGPIEDPEYIIMVKLSEPNPGEVRNFSSNTVGKPFKEMMTFALDNR